MLPVTPTILLNWFIDQKTSVSPLYWGAIHLSLRLSQILSPWQLETGLPDVQAQKSLLTSVQNLTLVHTKVEGRRICPFRNLGLVQLWVHYYSVSSPSCLLFPWSLLTCSSMRGLTSIILWAETIPILWLQEYPACKRSNCEKNTDKSIGQQWSIKGQLQPSSLDPMHALKKMNWITKAVSAYSALRICPPASRNPFSIAVSICQMATEEV